MMKNPLALLSFLLLACGRQAEPDARARMQGTWHVSPSAADLEQAAVIRLALADPPPTAEDIAAAGLTPQQAGQVQALLVARAQDPDAPQLQMMRSVMEGVNAATMEITADTMTFRLGTREQARSYAVLSSSPTEARLETVGQGGQREENVFRLVGEDEALLVEEDGETTRLERVTAGG